MSSHVPVALRRRVIERAKNCCEYCRIHQDDSIASHQIDHIIAEKHGGPTSEANLALSCIYCNRRKGSDISTVESRSVMVVGLFNPRTQSWSDHFRLVGYSIEGRTLVGTATAELLRFNSSERLAERRELVRAGRFCER